MGRKTLKTLLITGSSGFIGKNLHEYFQNKYKVFAPIHKELELLDAEAVRKYIIKNKINFIIHAAIVGGQKEDVGMSNVVANNLRIFFNIARNSQYVEKIIYFGSGLEYDKNRPLVNVSEVDFDQKVPQDDYGFYKYICRKYIEKSENIYDFILFGIFGKYEDYLYKFISNSIVKNLFKLPIVINQNSVFDYLFIDDLPKVVEYFLMHKMQYHAYNVTCGKKIDLFSIAKIINKISNYKSKIQVVKDGLSNQYTGRNKRLRNEITNLRFTSYEDAILKLYNWYKINLKKIDINKVKEDKFLQFVKTKNSLYEKK